MFKGLLTIFIVLVAIFPQQIDYWFAKILLHISTKSIHKMAMLWNSSIFVEICVGIAIYDSITLDIFSSLVILLSCLFKGLKLKVFQSIYLLRKLKALLRGGGGWGGPLAPSWMSDNNCWFSCYFFHRCLNSVRSLYQISST